MSRPDDVSLPRETAGDVPAGEYGTTPATIYMFPHENVDAIPRLHSAEMWAKAAWAIGGVAQALVNPYSAPTTVRQSQVFRLLNGPVGADVLPFKHKFGDVALGLGYRAPRSAYVGAGTDPAAVRQLVGQVLPEATSYFAKPVDGSKGRGTGLFHDLATLAESVAANDEDYLVQSDETPREDWRYVLHRDEADANRVWRIAYKKVRPEVVGDGTTTMADLIRTSPNIPDDKKSKIIHKIGKRAAGIPANGEITPVAPSGNISNGAYGQLPTAEELRRMDVFMEHFVGDLERELRVKLRTMCFDIGVLDTSALESDHDVERLRQAIVFYEFQVPFGVSGYLDEIYPVEGRPGERVMSRLRRGRLQARLAQSMARSAVSREN